MEVRPLVLFRNPSNLQTDTLRRAGTYARVFGVPRKFNGGVFFSVYFIRPVEDPHEVFFHLMEAIVVTLQHSRGQPVCTFGLFVDRLIRLNVTAKTLPLKVREGDGPSTSSAYCRTGFGYICAVTGS